MVEKAIAAHAPTENVAKAAQTAIANDKRHTSMHSDKRSPALKTVLELVACLCTAGSDHGGRQRYIYGDHAYTVLNVEFLDKDGKVVPLKDSKLTEHDELMKRIDPEHSTVRLQNPHHANTPDVHGTRKDNTSGVFSISLASFFRTFVSVDSGAFPLTK